MKSICYVLRSFPLPSETFIANEAITVRDLGNKVAILYLHEGNTDVVHPVAQSLIDTCQVKQISQIGWLKILRYLLSFMMASPLRTFRTLIQAFKSKARWSFFQALEPAWWCYANKNDFIHAHFADVNFLYAAAISSWSKIPFGITTHGYDLRENPIGHEFVTTLFKQASLVVTISNYNKNFMAKAYGLDHDLINVIHCGIDLSKFKCLTRHAHLTGMPIHLLNVGRLVPEKGHTYLLKALAVLKDNNVPFELDIVGGGPLLKTLRDEVSVLGIAQFVHFHGAQSEGFVREMHARCNLFVLPSISEGLPVAIMEALALCTPVIATRITGIPELIKHGETGILVEPEDTLGLARSITEIYRDPKILVPFMGLGRNVVEREFNQLECSKMLIALWTVKSANL